MSSNTFHIHLSAYAEDSKSYSRVGNNSSTYPTCNLLFIRYHITVRHKAKITPYFTLSFESRHGEGILPVFLAQYNINVAPVLIKSTSKIISQIFKFNLLIKFVLNHL